MIRAAGILFLVGNTALFLRRGDGGDHGGEWCCPGGKIEGDETAEDAAIRECEEECGFIVKPSMLRAWTRTVSSSDIPPAIDGEIPVEVEPVDFTTFIVRLPEQFTPVLCDESDGYCWAPVTGAPQPLHPGMQVALDRLTMDELGVARAIAAGRLASPQKYENVWLFAIRITGTGISYRHARKEFVWRDPSNYLNDEFLARCNGLSVIWEHPKKSLLNHDEFSERIVGSVMLPYLRADKPDEVWGVAKIYDDDAAHDMSENAMSTSPAVNFSDPTENDRVMLEGGKIMLIEGKPSLLDHIAICPLGVWDKSGPPTGVESVNVLADSAQILVITKPSNSFNLLRASAAALALKAQVRAAGSF